MIARVASRLLRSYARQFRVVAILGPRQSGKTTLARATFARKPYASLEDPDERAFANDDPRGFLARFPRGAVLDEVQRCPALLSYIQTRVDDSPALGQFVLTGSQQFHLTEAISVTGHDRRRRIQTFDDDELLGTNGQGDGFEGPIDDTNEVDRLGVENELPGDDS